MPKKFFQTQKEAMFLIAVFADGICNFPTAATTSFFPINAFPDLDLMRRGRHILEWVAFLARMNAPIIAARQQL